MISSVETTGRLAALPDVSCIDRALRSQPSVTKIEMHRDQTKSTLISLPPREITTTIYSWSYTASDQPLIMSVVSDGREVSYTNGLSYMNVEISEAVAQKVRPIVAQIDKAVSSACDLSVAGSLSHQELGVR